MGCFKMKEDEMVDGKKKRGGGLVCDLYYTCDEQPFFFCLAKYRAYRHPTPALLNASTCVHDQGSKKDEDNVSEGQGAKREQSVALPRNAKMAGRVSLVT